MALPVDPALLAVLAVAAVACVLIGIGLWIWYAIALSALFPRLGGEGWKGWVPVLNEAELFARGGVAPWGVIFFFIPVVQLYGLFLKIVAAHRIGARFRHGAGFTALAVLIPPLWATLLAIGPDPIPETSGSAPQTGGIRTRVASPRPAPARDASGYAIPTSAPEPALIDAVPGGDASDAPATDAPVTDAPPIRESWLLVLDDGSRVPLTGRGVVLGRAPAGGSGDQTVRIADVTRTLSKTHARLDRDGGGWRLTDLGSTNGVRIVGQDGAEKALPPGASAVVHGRILLGDVGMLIVHDTAA
ncbi:DUF5684 domain-containing protein [Microbacterium sp. 22242]|uniref:DUF5684 domain-containing protein n=1 Tax=Microbacterium sp. 22242 TaxID=3453896 RepID=UPI003F8492FB